jgi:type IV pilus assembly protein PilA
MRTLQRGFTLIELMIVVAIVGILAAVALPAYQDYLVRSKITELAMAVAQCKTAVSEYLTSKSVLPATLAESGCAATNTGYGQNLTVNAGVISIQATANVGGNPDQAGLVYALTPSTAGTSITYWDCSRTTGGTTLDAKYLPALCRG